jgi:DNA topoisomerase-2
LELENEKLENDINGVEKLLKLTTTVSTTNMHLFDAKDKLKKYDSVIDIIDDYYETRLNYYVKRKTHLIQVLENELMVLSNKARFIQENLTGSIDLRKKTKDAINTILKDKKFDLIAGVGKTGDYNYLVKMPMDSVSAENVEKLLKEKGEKELELEIIKMNSINQMWMIELEKFEEVYKEFIVERNLANVSVSDENNKIGKKKVIKKVLKVVS